VAAGLNLKASRNESRGRRRSGQQQCPRASRSAR